MMPVISLMRSECERDADAMPTAYHECPVFLSDPCGEKLLDVPNWENQDRLSSQVSAMRSLRLQLLCFFSPTN